MNSDTANDLIQAVIGGVEALQKKTFSEVRSIVGDDYLIPPSLPLGDGKSIWITPAGLVAVDRLAALWRRRSPLGKQTSANEARKATALAIAKLLVGTDADGAEPTLTPGRIDRAVDDQISSLLSEVTHYFQAHLFRHSTIECLNIGPVFLETSSRWKSRVLDIQGDDVDRSKHGEWFVEAPWVGSVTVRGRTLERSREHAAACLRLALDSLTLPMTINQAREVRGPSDTIQECRSHSFTQHENGFLGFGISREVFGLRSGAEAIDSFVARQQSFLDLVGDAISGIVDEQPGHANANLKRRWLEALYWFGEARRSPDDFVALVKTGIVLDILSGGGRAGGIITLCSNLWGCAEDHAITSDGRSVKKLVDQIYNEGRSRLAHGGRFGLLEEIPLVRNDADRFTAIVLVNYMLRLARYKGRDDAKAFRQTLSTPDDCGGASG